MTRLRNHPVLVVLTVMLLLAAAACSSSGGKKAEENTATAAAGKATTPRITIAMVTHGAPGDTFWDIIRKGAQAAAAKDNVTFKYSADPDSGKQATLIQSAIDSKVDGIAVVAFNAGIGAYQQSGALSYFGSDESLAGQNGGKRASADGFKHVLCVIQEQGQVQSGDLQWAIDQQPFLQGYESVDSLWLYKTNGNVLGGGQATLTGPYLVDKSNIDFITKFAETGTR